MVSLGLSTKDIQIFLLAKFATVILTAEYAELFIWGRREDPALRHPRTQTKALGASDGTAEYEVECRPRNHSPSPQAAETLAPH